MINDTQTRLSDEVAEPLLLDILSDRELNTIIQKHYSSENIEIEIKISQQEKTLFVARRVVFSQCPCIPPKHNVPNVSCTHSVDAAGKAICG